MFLSGGMVVIGNKDKPRILKIAPDRNGSSKSSPNIEIVKTCIIKAQNQQAHGFEFRKPTTQQAKKSHCTPTRIATHKTSTETLFWIGLCDS